MALFTESELRKRSSSVATENYHVCAILESAAQSFKQTANYDIFLSHSFNDAQLILGVKLTLEDLGYSVYVDWINDHKQLDRTTITKSTADTLRKRMNSCKSLFYVTTENSEKSKWMPWECGYFDGHKEKVAIMPIKKISTSNEYQGQEYLGLYPYSMRENDNRGVPILWIHKNKQFYLSFNNWVQTPNNDLKWQG